MAPRGWLPGSHGLRIWVVVALASVTLWASSGWGGEPEGVAQPREHATPCPEGVIAARGWPGEWPRPIVHVTTEVELEGRTSPCDETPTVDCVVPPGLYHPWAATEEVEYVTVRAVIRYLAATDTVLDELEIKEGTVVEVYQYLGEGLCEVYIGTLHTSLTCPDVFFEPSQSPFEELGSANFPERQLFHVWCEGGGEAWIEADEALFETPSISFGEFLDYGVVAAPDSGGWTP